MRHAVSAQRRAAVVVLDLESRGPSFSSRQDDRPSHSGPHELAHPAQVGATVHHVRATSPVG